MTGFMHLMYTSPEGSWTKSYDGGADTVYWKFAEWTGIEIAGVTDISIRARAAATEAGLEQAVWTGWMSDSPASLIGVPALRWLQMQVKLSSTDPEKTPILQKVVVHWAL
jgi:hypothetical protein